MAAREIIDETEIFTEALVASVTQGKLTVDQLKRQLEDGLAYVEPRALTTSQKNCWSPWPP